MPYASSEKRRDLSRGVVADPLIEATSRASNASRSLNTYGDGAASTSLVPDTAANQAAKDNRFRS